MLCRTTCCVSRGRWRPLRTRRTLPTCRRATSYSSATHGWRQRYEHWCCPRLLVHTVLRLSTAQLQAADLQQRLCDSEQAAHELQAELQALQLAGRSQQAQAQHQAAHHTAEARLSFLRAAPLITGCLSTSAGPGEAPAAQAAAAGRADDVQPGSLAGRGGGARCQHAQPAQSSQGVLARGAGRARSQPAGGRTRKDAGGAAAAQQAAGVLLAWQLEQHAWKPNSAHHHQSYPGLLVVCVPRAAWKSLGHRPKTGKLSAAPRPGCVQLEERQEAHEKTEQELQAQLQARAQQQVRTAAEQGHLLITPRPVVSQIELRQQPAPAQCDPKLCRCAGAAAARGPAAHEPPAAGAAHAAAVGRARHPGLAALRAAVPGKLPFLLSSQLPRLAGELSWVQVKSERQLLAMRKAITTSRAWQGKENAPAAQQQA